MPGSKNLKSWLKSDIFCKVLIFRLKNYSLKRQDVKTLAMLVREDEFRLTRSEKIISTLAHCLICTFNYSHPFVN